jgi:catechol 2,3-dioxygenase-like lactoylglutathione lyase family enzyme
MYCPHYGKFRSLAMPPALAYDNRAWPGREAFVSVVAFDCLYLPVSDLQRGIEFYSGLFAMRVIAGGADTGRVVLSRGGRVRLALYAHGADSAIPFTRASATVESLESAREVVWDLGIRTIRDFVDRHGPGRGREGDSFVIADPDGHEIHFIERSRNKDRTS